MILIPSYTFAVGDQVTFKLEVIKTSDATVSNFDQITVSFVQSDLFVYLKEGTSLEYYLDSDLSLSAISYDVDLSSGQTNGITFSWNCFNLNTFTSCTEINANSYTTSSLLIAKNTFSYYS